MGEIPVALLTRMKKMFKTMPSITPGRLGVFALTFFLGTCPARGINEVFPGDNGVINYELSTTSNGATDMENVRVNLVSPSFMVLRSSESNLGPVTIPKGQAYTFRVHYHIEKTAPIGCFRAFVQAETSSLVWPNLEERPHVIDFFVLPAAGSPGKYWATYRAAHNCQTSLNATEPPTRKTYCRHKISDALGNIRDSSGTVKPLFFSEQDRTRQGFPVDKVIILAKAGNVPAILELGFRNDGESMKALRELIRVPDADTLLASMNNDFWECNQLLNTKIADMERTIPALRLALARRGDEVELRRVMAGLDSSNADIILQSIAALGYIGGKRSDDSLAVILGRPDIEKDGRRISVSYAAMNALESLHPEVAIRIDNQAEGPAERLRLWREWAKTRRGP